MKTACTEPLSFGIASGRIEGRLVLNGREEVPSAATNLKIRSIKLAEFFRGSDFAEEMGGTFGGRIELEGQGRSTAELLGNSNGGVVIVMTGGKISNLLLELVGIDIAEALGFAVGKDQPVAVRCAVADFRVRDGLLKTQTFVLDTTDTNVTGKGTVNLKNEKMDLKLGQKKIESMYLDHLAYGDLRAQLSHALSNPKSVKPDWLPF